MQTLEKITIPNDVKIVKHIPKCLGKNKNSTTREIYSPSQFYEGQRVLLYHKKMGCRKSFFVSGGIISTGTYIFGGNFALSIVVDKKYRTHQSPDRSYIYKFIEDAWEIE